VTGARGRPAGAAVLLLTGLLGGGVGLAGVLHPFGPAVVAAASLASPGRAWLAAVGVALSALVPPWPPDPLATAGRAGAAAAVLVAMLALSVGDGTRPRLGAAWVAAALSALSLVAMTLVSREGWHGELAWRVAATAAIAGCAAWAFAPALELVAGVAPPARRRGADAVATVGLLVLLCLCAVACRGVDWRGIDAGRVALGAIAAVAAVAGGPLTGAAAGLVGGVLGMATGAAAPMDALAYGAGGLLGGACRGRGRLASAAGFWLGAVVPAALVAGPMLGAGATGAAPAATAAANLAAANLAAARTAVEAGASAVLLLLLPRPALMAARLLATTDGPLAAAGYTATRLAASIELRQLAAAMRALAAAFSPPPEADRQTAAAGAAAMLAAVPATGVAPGPAADAVPGPGSGAVPGPASGAVPGPVELVVDRVCRACPSRGLCWQEHFHASYRALSALTLAGVRDGGDRVPELGGDLRRRCLRPSALAVAAALAREVGAGQERWAQAVSEARGVVAAQLEGIGGLIAGLADALGQPPRLRAAPGADRAHCLGHSWAAQCIAGGTEARGDGYVVREVGPGRLLVAISNGRGAGGRAAEQSALALRLLERLAGCGIDHGAVVAAVNAALLLRSFGETFAVLDVALLDLAAARAEFLKIGAPSSYLCRGPHVEELAAPLLPAGVLERVDVSRASRPLFPGDTLVLVSRGVLGPPATDPRRRRRAHWLPEFLGAAAANDPRALVRDILDSAASRDQGERADDMTVVAVHLLAGGAGWSSPVLAEPSAARAPVGPPAVGKAASPGQARPLQVRLKGASWPQKPVL